MSAAARHLPLPADLASCVDAIWSHGGDDAEPSTVDMTRVLPDGCMDLIFRSSSLSEDGHLFVSGTAEQAQLVPIRPGEHFVGVRFRTGMSRIAIDADPCDLRDRDTPARSIDARLARVEERLRDARSVSERLDVLVTEARGWRREAHRCAPPRRIRVAIERLRRAGPDCRVSALARDCGVTVRSLHRDVVTWTGLSPKMLARVGRLQHAANHLRADPTAALSALAQGAGYADHAHMTREFQTLAGLPPSRFARELIDRKAYCLSDDISNRRSDLECNCGLEIGAADVDARSFVQRNLPY